MIRVVPGDHPHAYAKVTVTVEHVDGVANPDVRVCIGRSLKSGRAQNENDQRPGPIQVHGLT